VNGGPGCTKTWTLLIDQLVVAGRDRRPIDLASAAVLDEDPITSVGHQSLDRWIVEQRL